MNRTKTLQRIHRVRTLQLGLARADEMRTGEALDRETILTQRIAALVDAVAPVPQVAAAQSIAAAAYFRERLQQSADASIARLHIAEMRATAAADATRSAKRDESAVEKLIGRARAADVRREMRAMEDAPPVRRKRHDPC